LVAGGKSVVTTAATVRKIVKKKVTVTGKT